MIRVSSAYMLPKQFIRPNVVGNDVVLTRVLTTKMRGGQLIDSSVLDEPETDHAIPRNAGVISVFRRTWRLLP